MMRLWFSSAGIGWLVACSGAQSPGSEAGIDLDGDGISAQSGDCDDQNDAIFPGAVDWPGDGIDQDCDGEDDSELGARGLDEGELLITEFMRDPLQISGALGEWLEVKNLAEVTVDLQELVVTDGLGDVWLVPNSVIVAPGGYAVFGPWPDPDENGGVTVSAAWGDALKLGNELDTLELRVDSTTLDSVGWTPLWDQASGYALALDPEAHDSELNDDPEAWCLAETPYGDGGFGTPGEDNLGCSGATTSTSVSVDQLVAGDLVITEVMNNPDAVLDENGEWLEIWNGSGVVVNLQGIEIVDDDGNQFQVVSSIIVAAEDHVVLGVSADRSENGDVDVAAAWGTTLGLGNGLDGVTLMAGGQVIDEVHWDDGVVFPNAVGVAMSLDSGFRTALDNDDGANWCGAETAYGSGDLGTPGTENPACP